MLKDFYQALVLVFFFLFSTAQYLHHSVVQFSPVKLKHATTYLSLCMSYKGLVIHTDRRKLLSAIAHAHIIKTHNI